METKFNKQMTEIFDVELLEVDTANTPVPFYDQIPVPIVHEDQLDKDVDQDYEAVRKMYKKILFNGETAISELQSIAAESEHPRAYEVLANLMKTVTDMGDNLIKMQKTVRDIKKIEGGGTPKTTNIDKAIFVGSTAELAKYLKENKE